MKSTTRASRIGVTALETSHFSISQLVLMSVALISFLSLLHLRRPQKRASTNLSTSEGDPQKIESHCSQFQLLTNSHDA